MISSLVIAFSLPFWLFLFSYAVLGPLHYLTEISWLRKKNFFTTGKYDFLPLVLVALIWSGTYLFLSFFNDFPTEIKVSWFGNDWREVVGNFRIRMNHIVLAGLIGSAAMAFVSSWRKKIIALVGGFGIGVMFSYLDLEIYSHLIGTLLPTLIHVFLFTGIFMLYGALKSRSKSGLLGVLLFFVCGVLCFLVPTFSGTIDFDTGINAYRNSSFHSLNAVVMNFNQPMPWNIANDSLFDDLGIQLQRFIAFAYTYHYLNWFSKTSIIGWHKISKISLIVTALIWVLSVSLYVYDYTVGLKVLLFLSILHVVLEFPLNAHSFVGVFRHLIRKDI